MFSFMGSHENKSTLGCIEIKLNKYMYLIDIGFAVFVTIRV